MTFQEWRSQHPGQLFAIVDAALDTTAVADYCNQGGSNAIPLFAGTAFVDLAEQGPWLLPNPTTEFIAAHQQLGGVYIESDTSVEVIQRHWQSLIEVAFEGEVMWLRYADNRVFPKMLATMSQQELDDVLGPSSSLWANDSAWQRTPDTEFTPRQAPWFRIQPHHLTPLYDESRHAYILSRHFWQWMENLNRLHCLETSITKKLLRLIEWPTSTVLGCLRLWGIVGLLLMPSLSYVKNTLQALLKKNKK